MAESWVNVETASIKCLILISTAACNAACEFVIIYCTVFSSNVATDDIAGWRFCAGSGESGLRSEERTCSSSALLEPVDLRSVVVPY